MASWRRWSCDTLQTSILVFLFLSDFCFNPVFYQLFCRFVCTFKRKEARARLKRQDARLVSMQAYTWCDFPVSVICVKEEIFLEEIIPAALKSRCYSRRVIPCILRIATCISNVDRLNKTLTLFFTYFSSGKKKFTCFGKENTKATSSKMHKLFKTDPG